MLGVARRRGSCVDSSCLLSRVAVRFSDSLSLLQQLHPSFMVINCGSFFGIRARTDSRGQIREDR